MEKKKDIMEIERILPPDFDGTFRFTNWTDEDFVGKWNSKEYVFPAGTTSPILMTDATPLEIQQIRKKFAMDLATREFGKSEKYNTFLKRERNIDGSPRGYGMSGAGQYSVDDLTSYIQKCLDPLPAGKTTVRESHKVSLESKLSRDEEGNLNTKAVKNGASMKDLAKAFEKE